MVNIYFLIDLQNIFFFLGKKIKKILITEFASLDTLRNKIKNIFFCVCEWTDQMGYVIYMFGIDRQTIYVLKVKEYNEVINLIKNNEVINNFRRKKIKKYFAIGLCNRSQ